MPILHSMGLHIRGALAARGIPEPNPLVPAGFSAAGRQHRRASVPTRSRRHSQAAPCSRRCRALAAAVAQAALCQQPCTTDHAWGDEDATAPASHLNGKSGPTILLQRRCHLEREAPRAAGILLDARDARPYGPSVVFCVTSCGVFLYDIPKLPLPKRLQSL